MDVMLGAMCWMIDIRCVIAVLGKRADCDGIVNCRMACEVSTDIHSSCSINAQGDVLERMQIGVFDFFPGERAQ